MPSDRLPTYQELLARSDAPAGSSWGLFGPGAEGDLGTVSLLDSQAVLRGIACVVSGERFGLNYPIDAFDPPMLPSRPAATLTVQSRHPEHRDDVIDGFNPQSSSQLDGLTHRRHEHHGFYNGAGDGDVDLPLARLGVQAWAERGIVGRAIVIDLQSAMSDGTVDWHSTGPTIEPEDLEGAMALQDVAVEPGDIVILHTGWSRWYLDELNEHGRADVRARGRYTGLAQHRRVLEWMWDHHVAVIGTDTYAVEAMPPVTDSDFTTLNDGGMMHQELLALLGLALGELWRLDELVRACQRDGRWSCLLVSAPLNVVGGVSTPANALAIR